MGGKALNKYGVSTERKNTEEFNQIGNEIGSRVFSDLTYFTEVVKCYHTKADHGDLDLLIKIPIDSNINWVDYIKNTFKPRAINANGGVYSFDYKNFQIDFIPVKESKWETAKTYFSYDPLGNIMGKTYHKFGLSYGWDGLFYKFRNQHGSNSANILISNDSRKIFEFGGYDYDRYLKGFDTVEEIIMYCVESKFFDSEMFKMENLKHIDKKRNRKRGSYHLFLDYLKNNGINKKYVFDSNKDNYLSTISLLFPDVKLLEQINSLKEDDKLNNIASQKFNGDIVMYWLPNLQGKELGAAIGKFQHSLGDDYRDFILNNDYHTIKSRFISTYNEESE